MEVQLKETERIDDLQLKELKLIQDTNGFCFGIDAVLLANFAKVKKGAKVVDLGTGTGIVPILIAGKSQASKIIGVEIQKDIYELAVKSVFINNLDHRVELLNKDIKEVYKEFRSDSFDTIVSNPPYFKVTENINEKDSFSIARHEIFLTISDIISISKKLLKNKGNLAIVIRPDRLIEIIELMRKNNIEPKRLKFIYPKLGKESNIMLIEGIKNGKPGLKVLDPLYVYQNNEYSKDLLNYVR